MTVVPVTLLVVAKAPVAGRAKTRLAATVGDQVAAEIAAAALLDTLDAVADAAVATRVVALTGELDA
ncbi:MAG: glycosyltransferase, partial [Mycobacterium sp.]